MTAHKVDLSIESASGNHLGSVVVGIPEEQFLKFKTDFSDIGFMGQNPKLNKAIRDSLTKQEKEQIANHLGIQNMRFALTLKSSSRPVDEAKEKPSFESNGKKFWIS
jgi:hypothetical protein